MKKLKYIIIPVCFILFFAATFHNANQSTVAWDAVHFATDGTAIDSEEISYKIYLYNLRDPIDKSETTELGTTENTQYTITFNEDTGEGKFYVGIQTLRIVDEEVVSESEIAWSDDPLYDFGLKYYKIPNKVINIRLPE